MATADLSAETSEAFRDVDVYIVATFDGRFVYRVRCSYHGTVEATMDYSEAKTAKSEHLIEHGVSDD